MSFWHEVRPLDGMLQALLYLPAAVKRKDERVVSVNQLFGMPD